MKIDNIKIGYLGKISSSQCDNILSLFKNIKKEIPLLGLSEDNLNEDYQKSQGFQKKIIDYYSKITGTKKQDYKKKVSEYFNKYQVDCLLAYWGTIPIADIISIKKYNPDVKIILNVLCHPTGLSPLKIYFQNKYFNLSAKYLDGLIYTSQTMKEYFDRNVWSTNNIKSLIFPPYLSKEYFPDKRLSLNSNIPNLLFLGRMDWWASQETDNVLKQITTLMDLGIHIFHSDKTNKLPYNCNRHTFKPIDFFQLKNFATQFDASLIIYNLDHCSREDRFRVTIPDRLAASIAMGLPIAIPKHGYDACKEFLKDYKAIIEFESYYELKEKLNDRKKIEEMKMMAIENSKKYIAEFHFESLLNFICSLFDNL